MLGLPTFGTGRVLRGLGILAANDFYKRLASRPSVRDRFSEALSQRRWRERGAISAPWAHLFCGMCGLGDLLKFVGMARTPVYLCIWYNLVAPRCSLLH